MSIWVGQDGTLNDDDGDGAAAPVEQAPADGAAGSGAGDPGAGMQQQMQQPDMGQQDDQQQQQQQQPRHRRRRHHRRHHKKGKGGSTAPAQVIPASPIYSQGAFDVVGWMEPFTDWDGYLFEKGAGQYKVFEIGRPWYPATEPANVYPPEYDDEEDEPNKAERIARAQLQALLGDDLDDEDPVGLYGAEPPELDEEEEVAVGFEMPLTDWDGNLLVAAHPFHLDYQYPEPFGPPVMTGWMEPFTDLGGHLLEGAGQYGMFTVVDPYDHRDWDDVNFSRLDPEDNRHYRFFVGQDDGGGGGGDFGSMMSSALGSLGSALGGSGGSGGAGGGGGGGFGGLGDSLGNMLSDAGGSSGGIGSALGSIASAAAKVAVPALAKAGTQALSQAMQQHPSGGGQGGGGGGGGGGQPQQQPQTEHPAAHKMRPQHPAATSSAHPDAAHTLQPRAILMRQITQLADKYGIAHTGRRSTQKAAS
jgi:hypothetical protein